MIVTRTDTKTEMTSPSCTNALIVLYTPVQQACTVCTGGGLVGSPWR